MASISGSSKHSLQLVSSLVKDWRRAEAEKLIIELVATASRDELVLLTPQLRLVINDGFEKKRKRKLSAFLDEFLNKPESSAPHEFDAIVDDATRASDSYREILERLKVQHIFQWATHYTDNMSFIFRDLFNRCREVDSWQKELDTVSNLFFEHSRDICERGTEFSSNNGLTPQIIQSKAMGGFLKFLMIAIQTYIRERDNVSTASEAKLIWGICSSVVSGIVKGYAAVLGWRLLLENYGWLHALGFLKGTDAVPLLQEATAAVGRNEYFSTLAPTLIAFELIASRTQDIGSLTPRLSRVVSGTPPYLEVTLTAALGVQPQEVLITCFFSDEVSGRWDLDRALGASPMACVASLNDVVNNWVTQNEKNEVVDVRDVRDNPDHADDTAAIISSKIEDSLAASILKDQKEHLTRNYAKDFPLEDPNHRQMYMVDRYSVKQLLESVASKNGIHLWCSVRRSGKTTAALNFGDKSGNSLVIFQTMDQMLHQPQYNIFENHINSALQNGTPIPKNFFEGIINECQLSTAYGDRIGEKRIFILDEYETLFGMIAAMSRRDDDLRYLVCQPLLSQMVSFATRNLIIFMGQRPDAHYVLSAQNQLSPLVQQFDFPLFAHQPAATDSEFFELLKRVLSQKIKFNSSFADAVYGETSGHPFLTVNLLIDVCDWLIESHVIESQIELTAIEFKSFEQQRLTSAAISKSKYYGFFSNMMAEYLGEDSRRTDPWLHCIASVLKQIATQHPKVMQCPMVKYRQIADEASFGLSISRDQLLSNAVMANFLKVDKGNVKPAIKLMARLAASVTPRI
jgi:hypothetical protein